MKLIKILIISVVFFGCKTKTVTQSKSKEIEQNEYSKTISEVSNEAVTNKKEEINETKLNKHIEENQTDIDIEGETEIDKPFEMQVVQEGGAKKYLKISGKAKFTFKSNESSKSEKTIGKSKKSSENQQQNSKKNNLIEKGNNSKIKKTDEKNRNVKVKGWQFGAYSTIIIWGSIIIILIAFFLWFRKTELFRKIFKIKIDETTNN
ncbi:hypothetical protein [Chryseobacterium sp.]|uniref:hypothetical protein n=1 Tax=Chryseobacterium sp. TaxID=1871047 RepID=UPI0031E088B0